MSNYFKHKMRGKNPALIAGLIVLGIIAGTGLAILFGFIIMWLWNGLMPDIFGLPSVTYWQAVGLFILAKLIFGGFGGNSSKNGKSKHNKCSYEDNRCGNDNKKKRDFSKWEHYDKFWEEKGDQAYQEYVEGLESDDSEKEPKSRIEE